MRKTVRTVLLLYVFAIPWEYSLDLGDPFGNVARILGLVLLLVAIPATIQAGGIRTLGGAQVLTLVLLLWFCCTCFWTIDLPQTLQKLPGYAQEAMIVWLIWEFAESQRHLQSIFRAWLAGSWILAALTVANLSSALTLAEGQVRFAAIGQDPNDVARFLDLGFPIAALLSHKEVRTPWRLLALGYFPLGLAAVLLTASRGGVVAALVALVGSGALLLRHQARGVLAAGLASPLIAAGFWFVIPRETLMRLSTIGDSLQGGDLNQRLNIWEAGWRAFAQAPFFGHGAGSFVNAAGLAPFDTAHNTALSIGVESGVFGFMLAFAILIVSIHSAVQAPETIRPALLTLLFTWIVSSLVGSVAESRTTWLMFGVIASAARLHAIRSEPEPRRPTSAKVSLSPNATPAEAS